MLRHYFIIAFRNLRRNRLFTGLNIFGLSIGLSCSLLIFLWIQDELSYDRFNPGADRIFRITAAIRDIEMANVPYAFANGIKTRISGIRNATRIHGDEKIVSVGTRKFDEKNIFYADSNFLRIFNYPLLRGDAATVLRAPNSIVLTEATAIKYFGSVDRAMESPVFIDNNSTAVQVTGVLKNIPTHSHLQFDLLMPIENWDKTMDPTQAWRFFDARVYFQLDSPIQPTSTVLRNLEKQMEVMRAKAIAGTPAVAATVSIQPLTDIHLYSHFRGDVPGQGNIWYVRIFSLVALFILFLACINFMNLATALSGDRAKEVGLRKTVGALRRQLILQFLGESTLLAFLALALALLVVWLVLPFFNTLAGKIIILHLPNPLLISEVIAITFFVGLLAGSYPAFFISSFDPIRALKRGKFLKRSFLRDGFVILQFSISVILMVSTAIIYDQLKFIRQRDLGFDRNNLLYVRLPAVDNSNQHSADIRSSLHQSASVGDFTIVNSLPTNMSGTNPMSWRGMDKGSVVQCHYLNVDENTLQTFGMKMAAGRYYSNDLPSGDSDYVVNETAVRTMGLTPESAIGKIMAARGAEAKILGVVKDFNFMPLYQPVEPLVMRRWQAGGYVVARYTPGNMQKTLSAVKRCFERVFGDTPFAYGFIDQDLDRLYLSEARMGKLFNIFSVLSIVISCLGLFGLAAFATRSRTKEIGIRKVLGAPEVGIVMLLTKEFLRLVAVSLLIAFPLSWYAMHQWLQGFAEKVSISGWPFAAAGGAALLVASFTVSYQTIQAAIANPIDSLRSE